MAKGQDDIPVLVKKRKRQRKRPKRAPDVKRYYFTADTQRAIELYQSSDDADERERLYVEEILPAFDKLVENLICIYKFSGLYDSHDDLKNDCITFLYETLHKFDPTRGTKAFSYFNVVAKHWLIVRSKKRQQNMRRMISLDATDVYGRSGYAKAAGKNDSKDRSIDVLQEKFTAPGHDEELLMLERLDQLTKLLNEIRTKLTNENEIKCIDAIMTIFEKRDKLPMLNKRAVFTYIREISELTPKQLTMAISVIKRHYNALKTDDDIGIF